MEDNQIQLIVADNGSGLPDSFNINSSNSLGMQLVNSLVNQLDGSIKINRANGTEFNIQFKELIYKNRIYYLHIKLQLKSGLFSYSLLS